MSVLLNDTGVIIGYSCAQMGGDSRASKSFSHPRPHSRTRVFPSAHRGHMPIATKRIPYQLAHDLSTTLARLRCARMVDPRHAPTLVDNHSGCEVCTCERRLDWLIGRIPRQEAS